MTHFEKMLDDLMQGEIPLAPLRTWLEKAVKQPDCDPRVLYEALEKASKAGLSQPAAMALRRQIDAVYGDKQPADDAKEHSRTITSVTITQTDTNSETTGRAATTTSTFEPTKTDTDRTLTSPTPDQQTLSEPSDGASASNSTGYEQRTVMLNTTCRTDSDPTVTQKSAKSQSTSTDEYDPFSSDVTSAANTSEPTSTRHDSKRVKKDASPPNKIGTGAVLKERFELVNVLGEGGMGKVFRARDLLKVEAKDKNPFIAVKTLTGDFREHPEAFMALQREASKAQRLAHPNIATVFDFDRDGTTIYLTMELMEGEELSSYIKRLPAGGLPVKDAMGLIKQLCDGLTYAHSKGLVHSDFKPGNAFITNEGAVKLLDFGIARASKTRRDATGVTTIFDPSELGALTPAYASLEMFEGDDPDPRDDIYALACVSYELLTGKHPFNKLSAPKVLEKGLRPAPIAKLTKRQNRALMNALTITRDERTTSVEKFWDELRPRKNRILQYGPITLLILVLFILLGYRPVQSFINAYRNNSIVARLNSGNVDIPSILKLISSYDPDSQRYILENGKDKIIKYFESQAEAFVDDAHGQYNYPAAFDEIAKASSYFPDSAELLQERSSLETRRANLLSNLTTKFNQSLADDQIMPGKQGSITDIIKTLRMADPNDSLLHDERLINRYAQLVQKDLTAKNYAVASSVLAVGLDYAPDDPELLNLQDQIQRSLKQQQDGPRIAQLEKLLEPSISNTNSLNEFAKIRPYMLELTKLNPADPILEKLDGSLLNTMQSALHTFTASKNWGPMEKSLTDYSRLLAIDDLVTLRTALTQAEAHASYTSPNARSIKAEIDSNRSAIKKMLANPKYDSDWDFRLMNLTKETAALLQPEDMGWFKELRDNTASTYINLAEGMIKQSRFLAASDLLATGRKYAPQLPGFAQADQSLADAQQNFKQEQTERLHMAQIIALENQFQTQLNAGQISDARKTYLNIQNSLPVNDKFLTQVAPQAYAGAYLNLAKARAAIGDYHGAIALVQGGLQYAPLDGLKKALQDYTAQAERNDLMAMAVNVQPDGMDALKTKLASVQKLFPGEPLQIADELYRIIAAHIVALKTTNLVLANALLVAAKSTFPQSVLIRNTVLPAAPVISIYAKLGRAAMALNELSKAEGDLAAGQETETGNQDLQQFAAQLQTAQSNANRYFVAYQEYMRAGQSQQAKVYLAEAMRLWVDNPAFQAEYQRNFANNQAQIISPNGGQPCTLELAGYGRQGRAECYDFLGKGLQGPIMVVVPAGGGFKQPFAIGKYETSVGQINAYCRATGQCTPLKGENSMPATDIPFSEARNYVAWLSKRSNERYFIPSYIQYRYAASAGGTDTNQDFNCQVTLAGQVIKGLSMVNIETGRPNIWGLVNYVGNAQEWVLGSDGLEAAGGDYRDPLSQCSVDLVRPSNGAANPLTGFRVGRYLDK